MEKSSFFSSHALSLMHRWEKLGVNDEIARAVQDEGWMLPTDIQDEAIPLILGGGDVMAAAETGSGKTGAFAIPVLQIVHESLRSLSNTGTVKEKVKKVRTTSPALKIQLNLEDRDDLCAINPTGTVCQARHATAWGGCRANVGVTSGSFYYEAIVEDEGLCRVGWSESGASFNLGTDNGGFGFGGTGKKSNKSNFADYGESFGLNDVIGCSLDMKSKTISYSKNGKDLGVAFTFNDSVKGPLFPAVVLKNAQMGFNFGQTPFKHNPSDKGFKPLCQAGITECTDYDSIAISTIKEVGKDLPCPLAIILEPSKELADQAYQCLDVFKKYLIGPELNTGLIVGGTDAKKQLNQIAKAHVIVATPGRLMDFVKTNKLSLSKVRFFVLDETDRLIDDGNLNGIIDLYKDMPKGGVGDTRLQVCFFSATLHSQEIKNLSEKICYQPQWVDLKGMDSVPETVHHVVVRVNPKINKSWEEKKKGILTDGVHKEGVKAESDEAYSEGLKLMKPFILKELIDTLKIDYAIIFCRTNLDCFNLEKFMLHIGGGGSGFRGEKEKGKESVYSCCVLSGMRSNADRSEALQSFKNGLVRFLICTDVAARGIDVKGLPYVINFTLPDKAESYIHRIGRVGRAECMGLAISLVSEVKEKVWYHANCKSKGSKGEGCNNTALVENKGCTIWYDELALLGEVEGRLKETISTMGEDYSLPESVTMGESVVYGESMKGGGDAIDSKAHVDSLQPAVIKLNELQVKSQINYWEMQLKFSM